MQDDDRTNDLLNRARPSKTISGHKARGLRSRFAGKGLKKKASGMPGKTENADAVRELKALGLSQAEVAQKR